MPKAKRGRRTREPDQILRDARAVELRRLHLSYDQIAAQLGYSAKSSAYHAVQRGLADSIIEPSDEVRQMEIERLDELARRAFRVMAAKHFKTSGGKLIRHPETDELLIDDAPVLNAIETLLRIMDRRAKLLGLDSVQKVEIITHSMIDEEIAKLTAELAARERQE